MIDRLFGGGLPWRGLHEWIGMCLPPAGIPEAVDRQRPGHARDQAAGAVSLPVGAILSVVHRAAAALDRMRRRSAGGATVQDGGSADESEGRAAVLWIGRGVWPYPRALMAGVRSAWASAWWGERRNGAVPQAPRTIDASLVERSVFVDPTEPALIAGDARAGRTDRSTRGQRGSQHHTCGAMAWAIEQAVRCEDIMVVVADGSGLSMAETRRLHLAMSARASPQLVLLARPSDDRVALSAALTRWMVTPAAPGPPFRERSTPDDSWGRSLWTAHLLRCKATLASEVIRATQRYGLIPAASAEEPWGGGDALASVRLGAHWEALAEDEDVVLPALASA